MVRLRMSSNAGRHRARLISTPHPEGHDPSDPTGTTAAMSALIATVRFSDQLATLLTHAIAHGFRVEPDTRGKGKVTAVIVYPPDKDIAPINVSERGAKFNKAHYENVARDLLRAGLPPLMPTGGPSEVMDAVGAALAAGDEPPTLVTSKTHIKGSNGPDLAYIGLPMDGGLGKAIEQAGGFDQLLRTRDGAGAAMIGSFVTTLGQRAQLDDSAAQFLGEITMQLAHFMASFGEGAVMAAAEKIVDKQNADTVAATELAEEATARAERWEEACNKADARAEQAVTDCRDALARAKTAEDEVAKLRAAIAPFKALLNNTDV